MRHPRNEFTKETKRLAYTRSCGVDGISRCESVRVPSLADIGCNRELRQSDINYDHIEADAIGHDASLDNCAVLCRTCHAIKTDKYDKPAIAQDKRVADLARNIKDPWRKKLPGGKDDPFKLTVNNGTVDRLTGDPWRG